jgi:hypothetical protein
MYIPLHPFCSKKILFALSISPLIQLTSIKSNRIQGSSLRCNIARISPHPPAPETFLEVFSPKLRYSLTPHNIDQSLLNYTPFDHPKTIKYNYNSLKASVNLNYLIYHSI